MCIPRTAADPDFELRRGPGSILLPEPAFLPSVISSFFSPKSPSPRAANGENESYGSTVNDQGQIFVQSQGFFATREVFKTNICYLPAGRSVLGKTVPEVLSTSTARGRRLKTEGTVFPNTDRPEPANNVFIFFFRRVLCKQFLC